jgi:hypothetical protein
MKLKSSSWPMYMEEICIIQIQRASRAGALGPIFIIIFLNAPSAQWTATAVEERNISQLDIKLQERRLNMF